ERAEVDFVNLVFRVLAERDPGSVDVVRLSDSDRYLRRIDSDPFFSRISSRIRIDLVIILRDVAILKRLGHQIHNLCLRIDHRRRQDAEWCLLLAGASWHRVSKMFGPYYRSGLRVDRVHRVVRGYDIDDVILVMPYKRLRVDPLVELNYVAEAKPEQSASI